MATFLRNRSKRAFQSFLALWNGWLLAGLVVAGLIPILEFEKGDHHKGLFFVLLIGLVYCLMGWLLLFLPTALFLDPGRGRWRILIWSTIGLLETVGVFFYVGDWIQGDFDGLSAQRMLHSPFTMFVPLFGLIGGACYGWMRFKTASDGEKSDQLAH